MTEPKTPQPLDHSFTAVLEGNQDNGGWTIVVMPNSREFFGTGRSVKVVATVDGEELTTSLLPRGDGSHLLPIKASIRKAIGKESGQEVTIHLHQRLS